MTTALEVGEGVASLPDRSLPSGKTRYPLYRMLGGPQGRSGQVLKISPPPGFDPRTVQLVASRYTDYATRPTFYVILSGKYLTVLSNVTFCYQKGDYVVGLLVNRDGPGKENGCSCFVVVLQASYKSNSSCSCPVTVFCSARTIYCGLQFCMPTLKCHRVSCWGTPGVCLCICRGSVA